MTIINEARKTYNSVLDINMLDVDILVDNETRWHGLR